MCLDDPHHSPDAIEVFREWVVDVVFLRYSKHATIAVQCLLDRFHRSGSTSGDGHRHTGIHYRIA
jgi:hypothetical protein